MKEKFATENVCPVCGSENIEYDSLEVDGNTVYYPCECQDCECQFDEIYELDFVGHGNICTDEENIDFLSK